MPNTRPLSLASASASDSGPKEQLANSPSASSCSHSSHARNSDESSADESPASPKPNALRVADNSDDLDVHEVVPHAAAEAPVHILLELLLRVQLRRGLD
ncbi:unnamed protein product [Prorocentrum cordatum]|uniref:Uncharacterized protein n=1 Tax=Prorocentrum cordatum TaxID=2364126 RepID=A0ABN9T3W7_9DINO|nr:unnamed protein product [Polarella glacialis]